MTQEKERKPRAIEACANWLAYCLSIGWEKGQIDALESIWWEHHDEYGNLIRKSLTPSKESERQPFVPDEDDIHLYPDCLDLLVYANWLEEGSPEDDKPDFEVTAESIRGLAEKIAYVRQEVRFLKDQE